jgi:hypothetical protein
VRVVSVGSGAQFEDMNRAIEANDVKPVVDEHMFELELFKDAYQYMWERRHFGKVVKITSLESKRLPPNSCCSTDKRQGIY